MKNVVGYYYNLFPNDIHQKKDSYFFKIENDNYVFTKYNRPIEILDSLYNLNRELLLHGIYNHQIILNQQSKILTNINNDNYIMLKLYDDMSHNVSLDETIIFSSITNNIDGNSKLKTDDWGKLWSTKIDYYEYQVNQFGKKYPLIRESFSYFVGLTENGISLFNEIKKDTYVSVGHIRIGPNSTYFDLYNPINFVIDYPVRDISEYLKTKFIQGEDIMDDIVHYINSNLSSHDMLLFFIRMLYPSFYFDKYDEIISEKEDEKILIPIINKIDEYEMILKKTYNYLSYYMKMPDIDWLKK